jgi:stage II sporulation protein D
LDGNQEGIGSFFVESISLIRKKSTSESVWGGERGAMKTYRIAKRAFFLASALALAIGFNSGPADAAEKNIRVALFIDDGQGYRNTIPAVTLESPNDLKVELSGNGGSYQLPRVRSARFAVDQFAIVALETGNLTEAERIAQQLSKQKKDASITVETRGEGPLYRVVSGSFQTLEQANAGVQAVAGITGKTPKVTGPYHLEANTFPTRSEAEQWEAKFESSGISAHTVLVERGNDLAYAVWVGDEVSEAARDRLAQKVSGMYPGFGYRQPADNAYTLVDKEVVGSELIDRYVFSPRARLSVTAANGGGVPLVTVVEREGRQYRGTIELSAYKGKLAVVNDLPLDEYLYGVVGAEMATGWPLEALKAQAVLARTRAVSQGNKYGIANLSDTVLEQAYYGYGKEAGDIRRAVDETSDEVIKYRGKVIEALFYSNAGGLTADGTEAWGNAVPYLRPVESKDTYPQETANTWYLVELADGTIGYVRHDYINLLPTRNAAGLQLGEVNTDNLNLRTGPSPTVFKSLFTLPAGTQVTVITSVPEENAYSWTRGPYTPQEITAMINASQQRNGGATFGVPISQLEVTKRGPSGRVLAMTANGMAIAVSSPDSFRSVFQQGTSSLRSTKFDVEQMGTLSVLGANGQLVTRSNQGGALQAIGAGYLRPVGLGGAGEDFLVFDGRQWRVASKQQKFLIRGFGNGHGLGLSQYGAKAMAEDGYDYIQILQHYYSDVTIEP